MSRAKKDTRPRKRKEETKEIISVTISLPIKKRIDDLVEAGVARSRAQLIEDAMNIYLELNVDKWTDRGIYVDDVRVLLMPETISSLFFSTLTPEQQYEIGITAGRQAPEADVLTIKHRMDPRSPKSREKLFEILKKSGWGEITPNEDLIVIGSPFYPASFIRGYLEALMGVKLEFMETNVKDNVVLRILE